MGDKKREKTSPKATYKVIVSCEADARENMNVSKKSAEEAIKKMGGKSVEPALLTDNRSIICHEYSAFDGGEKVKIWFELPPTQKVQLDVDTSNENFAKKTIALFLTNYVNSVKVNTQKLKEIWILKDDNPWTTLSVRAK